MTFASATCGRGLSRVAAFTGSGKRDPAGSACVAMSRTVLQLPTPSSISAEPSFRAFAGACIRQVRASYQRARAGWIRGW